MSNASGARVDMAESTGPAAPVPTVPVPTATVAEPPCPETASRPEAVLPRTLVLVGLMGAGKSSIGRRLAQRLGVDFVDADAEIETAAGRTIPEIFEELGEATFRDG